MPNRRGRDPASPDGRVEPVGSAGGPQPAARRVRVTSSRRNATPSRRRPPSVDIAEYTEIGELYVADLIRAQYRLTLIALTVGAVTVFGLPLLFWLVPQSRVAELFGLPWAWVLLGVLFYPGAFALGWWYVRAARRLEQAFARAVGRA